MGFFRIKKKKAAPRSPRTIVRQEKISWDGRIATRTKLQAHDINPFTIYHSLFTKIFRTMRES
jgi:hypothetical protein